MPQDSAQELKRRADEHYDNDNYKDALTVYSEVIRHNPLDWRSWLNRGLSYSWLGNNESALQDLNRSLDLNPDSWIIISNKCTLLDLMGRSKEADDIFSDFCEKYPLYKQMLVDSSTHISSGTWYESYKVFGHWLPSYRLNAARVKAEDADNCVLHAEIGASRDNEAIVQ